MACRKVRGGDLEPIIDELCNFRYRLLFKEVGGDFDELENGFIPWYLETLSYYVCIQFNYLHTGKT